MASGPEALLIKKAREAGQKKYGSRLVIIKYHGSQFGEAGVSDLLCCLDGVFVAIEMKAPGKKNTTTLKQEAFMLRVRTAGGITAVCDSVEEFLETLTLAEHKASRLES